MELKMPPLLVCLCFGVLMVLLARLLPVGSMGFFGQDFLAKALAGLGILLILWALVTFKRANTTVDPKHPNDASTLVTTGPYRFSRNPMYLSMLLMLLALALYLDNAFAILVAALFVKYMNRYQIAPEEAALQAKFGKQYRQYLIKVRRWF